MFYDMNFLEKDLDTDRLAMKIYDEKHNIITNPDTEKGWLEDGVEKNSHGEWIMTQIYHPYTEEELKQKQLEKEQAMLEESRRQLTPDEAIVFFMRSIANRVDVPDQVSLTMLNYYPTFEEIIGQKVDMGYKFTYNDKMYKTIQKDLTIQEQYKPGKGTESLYTRIDIEHTGATYDPIPYEGNMELFKGKYYTQSDVLYLCTRDSDQALYHDLKDLVGTYLKVVNEDGDTKPPEPEQPTIQEWKQPTGAHDAYKKGDVVMFKGKKYKSLIDANVYSPETYPAGWKEIN